ncbi:MAG: prepilin-type N-terminal cleavage/methylation domain-containing protein [Alphaproteobacteria bacterium]|nr:prepilin-type N-terminal cleavage/methylation domain-containing protein [Alphaproteobacteria bacterium]
MWAAGKADAGVTLLEALVVIAVVALVAALIAPNIGASLSLLSLRQSASVMQADLRTARATAMRTNTKVVVTPLARGRGYDWIGGTRRLPGDIALKMPGPVVFMPDGSMLPAQIALNSGTRKVAIAFNTTTGAITTGGQ